MAQTCRNVFVSTISLTLSTKTSEYQFCDNYFETRTKNKNYSGSTLRVSRGAKLYNKWTEE